MNNTSYALPILPNLLNHGWDSTLARLLGDYHDDRREFNAIDAEAASGDYFVTLATRLDLLAQSLPRDSSEQIEIESLVNALFYLQKHYKVIAKHKLR